MGKLTYRKAGVDIEKARDFKNNIKFLLRRSFRSGARRDIGGFGGFFDLSAIKMKSPVLVSSADGVGTKLKIATLAHKHDTVGIDLVGMNVNDILCTGAEPLFFLDYIACSKLDASVLYEVVRGITAGCVQAGCALVGGETAEMPGMYAKGEYDLAGFCVGAAEKADIIDGSRIEAGDVILGIESSGLHSNGFSLVRKVFSQKTLKSLSAELLKPTRIYVKPLLSLLRSKALKQRLSRAVKGIAHITGGAFYDKIARILPSNADALIRKYSWDIPKIFFLIQNKGAIPERQMYHTLNMGIGMVLIVRPAFERRIKSELACLGVKSWSIGEIIKGSGRVDIV
ncbi:MAG: phosphoribosylformylglycinamidine cyclo-ligase [Candidatus Omnitrophota bacterium]